MVNPGLNNCQCVGRANTVKRNDSHSTPGRTADPNIDAKSAIALDTRFPFNPFNRRIGPLNSQWRALLLSLVLVILMLCSVCSSFISFAPERRAASQPLNARRGLTTNNSIFLLHLGLNVTSFFEAMHQSGK
jgi:hypothetical protein